MSKNASPKCSLQISEETYSALNTSEVQLLVGKTQKSAELISNSHLSSNTAIPSLFILLGKKTGARLKNNELALNYRILPGNKIKIGPIVGVLVARKKEQEYPLPVGHEAKIYKEMILEAKKKNIFLYFFYADGVNWARKFINGHIFVQAAGKKSGWVRGTFPLPDIIYNRIAYRTMERQNQIQTLINKASDESIYLFNSRFLDKWEVHRTLHMDPQTYRMLPETYQYSQENLSDCSEKFETLFIKPVSGSVGKGIIQVKLRSSNSFIYNRQGNKKGWQECNSIAELYEQLKIADDKKYIIQKGIDLAKINGNIFDIRLQVQKNGYGAWTFTGAGVRIAAPGNFVTHVPNGGSKARYETVIKEVFGESNEIVANLDQQLKKICRTVPRALEQGLGLSLAVLSMDLGIDANGQIWIIEVNSKPASFDEDEIRYRHLSLFNDYLLYKSEFVV